MSDRVIYDELIELVALMLASGETKANIKRAIYEANGAHCSRGTVEKLLNLARASMVLETRRSTQVLLGESIEFYRSILRDPRAKVSDKLEARKRLDELFGLGKKFNSSDMSLEEQAAALRDAVKEVDSATRTVRPDS